MTYKVNDLVLREAVLAELAKELCHLQRVATKQIRKSSKHFHYMSLLHFVIQLKQFKNLIHARFQVNGKQLGAIKYELNRISARYAFIFQELQGFFQVACCLGENIRILDGECASKLCSVPVLIDEEIINNVHATLAGTILLQEQCGLVTQEKPDLLRQKTILLS